MKVKKYPQSHLIITSDSGKKIIIDPGYLTFNPSTGSGFKIEDFKGGDAYLITHQHADHLDLETIKEVVGQSPVYGNSDVVAKLAEVGVDGIEVKDREKFSVDGVEITPIDIAHFTKPGVTMPQNTGFLIDNVFFHPGDGWKLEGVHAEKAAIPISGPADGDIGMNQGLELAKSLGAKVVIPIHNDAYPVSPADFAPLAEVEGIKVIALQNGEETEI
jgi:L-ascorbate metabolism protein UlaG (beta-lactamase superfamily)